MTRHRRVVVTSPQTRVAMARPRSGQVGHPAHLAPGDLERARAAYREQLRWALVAVALLAGILVGLPLVLGAVPWLSQLRIAGVPVSWLAVAVLPYPLLVALSQWQLHRAERVERDRR